MRSRLLPQSKVAVLPGNRGATMAAAALLVVLADTAEASCTVLCLSVNVGAKVAHATHSLLCFESSV